MGAGAHLRATPRPLHACRHRRRGRSRRAGSRRRREGGGDQQGRRRRQRRGRAARLRPAAVAQERQPGASRPPRRRTEELIAPRADPSGARAIGGVAGAVARRPPPFPVRRRGRGLGPQEPCGKEHTDRRRRGTASKRASEKSSQRSSSSPLVSLENRSRRRLQESQFCGRRNLSLDPDRTTTARSPDLSRPGPPARDVAALWRRLFVCATRSTANSSPRNHASSAAAHAPLKRTTSALRNRARLTARSATSTRSQSAGVHHREVHRYGDEASWSAGLNVDPLPIALELWQRSRVTARNTT